jgi:hypothetical protein
MVFSNNYVSNCFGQNIANKIMFEFLNSFSQQTWTTFSGSLNGYNLNNYDTIVCKPRINNVDSFNIGYTYTLNNELISKLDSSGLFKPRCRFDSLIYRKRPFIVINDLKIVKHGFVFEIRVIIGLDVFYGQFYYSDFTKKLLLIEPMVNLILE